MKTSIAKWLPLGILAGLLMAVSLLAAETGEKPEKVNNYVGDSAKKCKMCHKDQVAAWGKWEMAKSFDVLSEKDQAKDECIRCHVTGFGAKGGWESVKDTLSLKHVQCEACHGPAGDHMKAGMDKEKRKATMAMATPTKETCLKCHNKDFPDFEGFDYDKALKEIKHWSDSEE